MYEGNLGGPPTPPFRHLRGGPRKKSGCLGFWSAISLKQKITLFGMILGTLAGCGCGAWFYLVPSIKSSLSGPTAIPTHYPTPAGPALEPAQLTALAQIARPTSQQAPAVGTPPTLAATLTISQAAATATWVARINRPAVVNPASSPNYIGVMTYEAGCDVSNIGFTTAGLNGSAFYLYFSGLLDKDPNMQMVQVGGYLQQFDNCQYPVLMVSEIFWLNQNGTPAALAYGGPVSGTITANLKNPETWGRQVVATSTPTYTIYIPPKKDIPPAGITPTIVMPTYTPYPTLVQPTAKVVVVTATPLPNTPTATFTPQSATVFGRVVQVAGCSVSNFAIEAGGQAVYLVFAGAQLPPANPTDYSAMAVGVLDAACGGQVIRAQTITWYAPTPTGTASATSTPTLTATPTGTSTPTDMPTSTSTPTETATITPTEVITP
jgi:hypothetical protein